jgi:predicted AAA+ superfamily ATPase
MYILTGSRQFEMMQAVTQSLAGRTAVARLLPFSYAELFADSAPKSLNDMIYRGFYPRIHDKHLNPTEALSFYVSSYIERDVRQILAITDLRRFEVFLRLCAGRTGQLLNLQSLGNDCGVTHNTIKSWISVLQASGIIKLLSPWHANIGKRLIKSPKLYFLDTGLATFLIGIRSADQLQTHPLRGALFETFVVAEAYKQRCHAGLPDDLWFYRDSNGNEVDLLLETTKGLHTWEIKSAATISTDFLKGLNALERAIGQIKRCVIYGGDQTFKRQNTQMLPWQNIDAQFLP